MTSDNEQHDSKTTREEKARATLRESFLGAISELYGKPCNVLTYEKTTLNGTFAGFDPDGCEVLVRNLETPAHVKMNSALLRTPDILAIQFTEPVQLP